MPNGNTKNGNTKNGNTKNGNTKNGNTKNGNQQNRHLSKRLVQFVEHMRKSHSGNGSTLKVLDLRLKCRTERLREYADWPLTELDLIEQEAARYGNETELTLVLSGEVQPKATEALWLHSPSPVAWS